MNTTSATAPELNAQLFLQLSNIANNESYLQKTLDFIIGLAKSENCWNDCPIFRNTKLVGTATTPFR